MTVCIAAISKWINPDGTSGGPMIVGASDRMFSTPDTGYEPQQTKVFNLSPQVVALISGDVAAQVAICRATYQALAANPMSEVDPIAHTFAKEFALYRRAEAERYVLAPLGLTLDTFIANQHTMDADQVKRLTDVLQNWELDMSTIIAGVDALGGHVYRVVDPGRAICEDASGFVAIGVGGSHAVAQFIRARFTAGQPLARTLSLIYSAKRRAEAAPGVGADTDLFAIGPEPGGYFAIWRADLLEKLNAEYEEMVKREEEALRFASENVEEYVDEILKQAEEPPPEPGLEDESGEADNKEGV